VALLPDGARLQVLDVAKLFGLTPEASISRRAPAPLHAPDGAEVAVFETAERDEEGRPTLITLTTDPHAPRLRGPFSVPRCCCGRWH